MSCHAEKAEEFTPISEQSIVLAYANNLCGAALRLGIPRSRLHSALKDLLEHPWQVDGGPWDELPDESRHEELKLRDLERLLEDLTLKVHRSQDQPPCSLQAQIDRITSFFEFERDAGRVLALLARLEICSRTSNLWNTCFGHNQPSISDERLTWLAVMAGISVTSARCRSLIEALVQAGLCCIYRDGDLALPKSVKRLVIAKPISELDVTEHLVGRISAANLEWDDYSHLESRRDLAEAVLSSALARDQGSVSLLLYGPPGTGKTEFAKTLAQRAGFQLIAVGESDDEGQEPDRRDRLAALRSATTILAKRPGRIALMVDEAEHVLRTSEDMLFLGSREQRESGSKIYLHRMLDALSVPVIWIVNDISQLSEAVIRRMTLAMELRAPGVAVRKRIWNKALVAAGVPFEASDIDQLSREFSAPPAIISSAVRTASLTGGGMDDLRLVTESLIKAINDGIEHVPRQQAGDAYLPSLVNADARALRSLERCATGRSEPMAFSLCLFGPAGTGKSAYARHLADQLGLEVLQKRASDLMSKWVGGTERKIADAFREARESQAILIFDEADSLLRSRHLSRASWEVSQVNEMLTWMESHPLPFVCTTNLLETLDSASLRRFTFKVRFDYLTTEQARVAFMHFFGRQPPSQLDQIGLLTPSDFALVKKRAELGGFADDDAGLCDLLLQEASIKPDFRRSAGFLASMDSGA